MVDLIRSGFFSRGDSDLFEPLLCGLLDYDPEASNIRSIVGFNGVKGIRAYVGTERLLAD